MGSKDGIEEPLDIVAFHARSINRVRTLDLLAEGPIERRRLEETLDLSRPTLSRILDDFDAYGWITRDGHRYQATQLGSYVNAEFLRLIGRFDAVGRLGTIARWFPEEGFGFDLSRLSSAEIVQASKENAMATMRHIAGRVENAERVRSLSYSMLPYEKVVEDGQRFDAIFEPAALDVMRGDPTMRSWAEEMLASGSATIYRYDAEVPFVVVIVDDHTNLCLSGDDGSPRAVIDTEDEAIRRWAEDVFEFYRREASPVEPETFAR